ncbi:MAG: O-antigen ligase family protein [Chitinophagaceae bacterium]
MVRRSFLFLAINLTLGLLGFGMAFYNHGYASEVGTRGFIYAGNELTILVLAIGFIIATYFYQKSEVKRFLIFFGIFMVFAFLITSKTVLAGVFIIFLIPVISALRVRIPKKWASWILAAFIIGIPILSLSFYIWVTKSGIINRIEQSMARNDNDFLTILVSNRNNFVKAGWEVYISDYSWIGKLVGFGQQHHLDLSGHSAEVDFFSLLFASGIIGFLTLLLVISYWMLNALKLNGILGYVYAKSVIIFLLFLVIAANLSGHVFGSGIAGLFIGLAIALMFYKPQYAIP